MNWRNQYNLSWPMPVKIFVGIIVVLILLAAYGYFSGAWEAQ
jgi:hypothetical protein